jgi:hypothetical protein
MQYDSGEFRQRMDMTVRALITRRRLIFGHQRPLPAIKPINQRLVATSAR